MPKSDRPPLTQHLNDLVDQLCHHVTPALEGFEPKSVHQARVMSRRLKAALELIEPQLKPDQLKLLAKAGKKLRRRLGPLRDLDVMIDHVADLRGSTKLSPAVEWLDAQLRERREEARQESKGKSGPKEMISRMSDWWVVRHDLPAIEPAIPALIKQSVAQQLTEFSKQAEHVCASRSNATGHTSDPHVVRIAGKHLRYTLELADASGTALPERLLRDFKKLQGFLGTWHDYVVLTEATMGASLHAELPLHNPPLQRTVLGLIDLLLKRSQRELDRFCEFWHKQGGTISQTIQAAFGATSVAAEETADSSSTGTDV